jgi:hypothetical protein
MVLGPPDENGNILPIAGIVLPSIDKGVSTSEKPIPGRKYPWVFKKDSPVPPGLCVVNDRGEHWNWVPEAPTELNAYKALLNTAPFEPAF